MNTAVENTIEVDMVTVIASFSPYRNADNYSDLDRSAVGKYSYPVPAHLDYGDQAACALGIHQRLVPMDNVGWFDFTVLDEEGIRLEPDPLADELDLAGEYLVVWQHLKHKQN